MPTIPQVSTSTFIGSVLKLCIPSSKRLRPQFSHYLMLIDRGKIIHCRQTQSVTHSTPWCKSRVESCHSIQAPKKRKTQLHWLLISTPLKNNDYSQYMETKIHVPNHQPAIYRLAQRPSSCVSSSVSNHANPIRKRYILANCPRKAIGKWWFNRQKWAFNGIYRWFIMANLVCSSNTYTFQNTCNL